MLVIHLVVLPFPLAIPRTRISIPAMNSDDQRLDRRSFIKTSGIAAGAGAGLIAMMTTTGAEAAQKTMIRKENVVLFQGDSITDAGRKRPEGAAPNNQPGMGNGYAWLAAAELLVDHPSDSLRIFNRGISGNKVFQLAERWQNDCFDLKPDLLSILIGVNDFWHTLDGHYNGTVKIYERDFNQLLSRTKEKLPRTKIVICEPFVLRCGAVTDKWLPEFNEYRSAARRVAIKHKTAWVPFQAIFDEAVKYAPAEHWAADGVHPTPAGASLMAHAWLKVVAPN